MDFGFWPSDFERFVWILSTDTINASHTWPFLQKDLAGVGGSGGIVTTAGIKKDTVEFLLAKLRILTDESELLRTKVSKLEIENNQLRAQLQYPKPIPKLSEESRKALQLFCDLDSIVTIQELAGHLACPSSKARFACDELIEKGFVRYASLSNTDQNFDAFEDNSGYEITPEVRKFCFTHPE